MRRWGLFVAALAWALPVVALGQRRVAPKAAPLVGVWRLVASSEAKGKTKTGIPAHVSWETVEFTKDGRRISRHAQIGSPRVIVSEGRYKVRGQVLTVLTKVGSSNYRFSLKGKRLELRTGKAFARFERDG